MYDEVFPTRLAQLRTQKGVSARDMSLSIGQNPGYINNIESGKALPSMMSFFYICEYLEISPASFFDADNRYPAELDNIISDLKHLNHCQFKSIACIIHELSKGNS